MVNQNLKLYNDVRVVPKEALKEITAGRLKGKSDINPMWRIKTLTEQFGPCGIGWKYEVTSQWLEKGGNDEVAGFCNINLYVKVDGQWSDAIPGTGGSSFITKESKGLYTSDEVYKMALTDAISVACKALGIGADVYWSSDRTKYDRQSEVATQKAEPSTAKEPKKEVSQGTAEANIDNMVLDIMSSANLQDITNKWNLYKKYDGDKRITHAIIARRKELGV